MSDDLDQLIRRAASAHLALAPSSVLTTPGVSGVDDEDDLVARAMRRIDDPAYLAQLAPFDPEALMTSEPDHDPDSDHPTSAATKAASKAAAASSGTDDSGLHDIRALAQNAKQRISRKMPTVTDADDGMWASQTGQLKAIALPEPARLIALPELPRTEDAELARATAARIEARGASAATATAAADVTAFQAAQPRKRTGLWLGVAGVAAAAAVVVVVVAGGGGSKSKSAGSEATTVASAPPPPPSAPSIETVAAAAAPGPAADSAATGGTAAVATDSAAATAPARVEEGRSGAGSGSAPDKREVAKDPRAAGDVDPKATRAVAGAGSAAGGAAAGKEPKPTTDPKVTGDKTDPKGGKPGAGSGAAAATGNGEKSIDDLLGDATPKGGGDSTPKLEKKGLDGKDIKAGMAPLAGKAQACYDANGVAGHVKIKAVVDPSGKVIKVDATGEFAGTPTGSCVAAAVKAGASFPPWDGAPMTINYSYTLNE